jgi:hypothetical protein
MAPLDRGSPNVIQYAGFVDEKRVLTLGGGRLALWDVPACKAVWWLLGVSGPPALSPGHRHVAVCAGSSYDLFEVSTGERVGTLGGPAVRAVSAAAFRPDGKQFAALITTTDGKNLLTRWDIETGKVIGSFPMRSGPVEMSWAGSSHVMTGSFLVDLDLGWTVMNCGIAGHGRHAGCGPDGRHWFTLARDDQKPGFLRAQALPDAKAQALSRGVADKSLTAAMAPGMTVTVQVQNGPPGEADAARRAQEAISAAMQAQGFKVGPGGALTLTVQYQGPRATGETRQYESIGINKNVVNVSVRAVDGVATLRDGQGVIWEQKATYTTPDTIGAIRTDDIQATLDKQMWDNAAGFLGNIGIPTVVLRGSGGIVVLPIPMQLTGDR